jgi:hypothetical protein
MSDLFPPHDVGVLKCSEPTCDKTIKNHMWGKIKAEGWFFQKDDKQWCPDHIPDWVEEWRARRK